ncbi:MAG: hypothetical protein ABIU11_06705 [Chitinophagaceae bacterium]
MRLIIIFFLAGTILLIAACNKTDSPDPCQGANFNIQLLKSEAIGTTSNGSISITNPIGDTISYSLNSGLFQPSPNFTNLAAGNYIITIKNDKGCTDTAQTTILNYGPKYALVKQIILGYCGPCHLNGAVNGSQNFDTDAKIISAWDRIKARAVDNNPSQMPQIPNAPITNVDKQKITDWVNAGHRQLD